MSGPNPNHEPDGVLPTPARCHLCGSTASLGQDPEGLGGMDWVVWCDSDRCGAVEAHGDTAEDAVALWDKLQARRVTQEGWHDGGQNG